MTGHQAWPWALLVLWPLPIVVAVWIRERCRGRR